LNRPFKKLLALAGSAIVGFLGVLVYATPAQAHQTVITGIANCLPNGKYEIKWTVHTDNWYNRFAKIDEISTIPDQEPITGIQKGTIFKPGSDAFGTQLVAGDTKEPKLIITAKWYDRGNPNEQATDGRTGIATFADGSAVDGKCRPTPTCVSAADARYKHTFYGPGGSATIRLVGTLPLCEGVRQDFLLVSYYAPGVSFGTPQYKFDSDTGAITPNRSRVELNVDIPPCYTQVDLVWGGQSALIDPLTDNGPRYGDKKLGSGGAPGNKSAGPQGWYNGAGTQGRSCTTPKATFSENCDGTVVVHLANDGQYEATFIVKADGLEESVKVPAGKPVDFPVPAGKGKIIVSEQGKEVGNFTWTGKDCPPPTMVVESTCDTFILKVTNPQGAMAVEAKATYGGQEQKKTIAAGATETFTFVAGTETTGKVTFSAIGLELVGLHQPQVACGELPKTGDNTAGYIASGTGLVALGAVVFFLARRRMAYLRRLAS